MHARDRWSAFVSRFAALRVGIRLTLVLLALIVVAGAAWARASTHARRAEVLRMHNDTDTVFGPHTFSTSGSVTNHVETFNVSHGPFPQYRLVLENGNPNGTQRPDSVVVRFNGLVVANTASLQGQASIVVIVLARNQNVLSVTVGSSGSAFIKASVLAAPNPHIGLFEKLAIIGASGSYNQSFTFELPANVSTPHRILMSNGQENGNNRVNSGTISINGTAVLTGV
ncbi:MAG: hypothetical protein ACREMA_09455, partial [Longimicrobiales bacterium]